MLQSNGCHLNGGFAPAVARHGWRPNCSIADAARLVHFAGVLDTSSSLHLASEMDWVNRRFSALALVVLFTSLPEW